MVRLSETPMLVLSVVIIAVIAAIGLTILDKTKSETGSTIAQVNTSMDEALSAVGDITGWLGIIVVVVMGAIIIKLLLDSFGSSV